MLSVGATCFEGRFYTSAERVGEGRQAGATLQVTAQRAWSAPGHFSSCTNGRRKHSFHLVRAPFLAFQSAGTFPGQRALTIECLLMSGCGQGHKLVTTI